MQANISLRHLAALSPFATDASRFYIHGVRIEIDENEVRYIATDGHRLVAARVECKEPNTLTGEFTIPLEHCKPFKFTPRGLADNPTAVLTKDGDRLTLTHNGQSMAFLPILEASYPDWRRILPACPCSDEVAQFNGAYLADFDKLGKTLEIGKTHIGHNGDGPAYVQFAASHGEVFGVIMPFRSAAPSSALPIWISRKAPENETLAA